MKQISYSFLYIISGFVLLFGCGDAKEKTVEEKQMSRYEEVSKLLESSPSAALFNERARILFDSLKYNEALQDLETSMKIDSVNPYTYYLIAKIYRESEEIPLCYRFARKAESLGSGSEDLFLLLAELELIKKNKESYQKSIEYSNKALKVNQTNPLPYFYKGMVYEESGDVKRAKSSYQTAIELDNHYVDAYSNLVNLLVQLEEYEMASQYIESALRFNENDKFIWYNYGVLLHNQELLDSAMRAYERTIELDSNFSFAYFNKGLIHEEKDQVDQAKAAFKRVIEIQPRFEQGQIKYGKLLIETGRFEDAKTALRSALINIPESEELQSLYNSVKNKTK